MNCLALLFLFLTLHPLTSPARAQLAVMPAVFFYAFVTGLDFMHYSSETLPVLLMSVCLYRNWTDNPTREIVPELAGFIDENYTLHRGVELVSGASPVRIYLLNERAARLKGQAQQATPPAN